jgi:RHS repeat-associated protein
MLDLPSRQETTRDNSPSSFLNPPPSISLPKGGGAIRDLGEKFTANPVTGTSSMSVPIYVSPGRSGFSPQLNLSYDSGEGNGVFGLGWNLALPCITRKTDKGLPRYLDDVESDVFILSGAEDLVPILTDQAGTQRYEKSRTVAGRTYSVRRYRPRVEGLFARIERWSNINDSTDVFWRSISRDNITTLYGRTRESRIFDPDNPEHIFQWFICETYDDRGNAIVYRYKPEDSAGVRTSQAHELNRSSSSRSANRYLKRVFYGNNDPYLPRLNETDEWPLPPNAAPWDPISSTDLGLESVDASGNFHFELVFDYGEHDDANPLPADTSEWLRRNDPFSIYRATFEVRTYRLCQRVLMFHHFENEPRVDINCLVRATNLTYSYEVKPSPAIDPIFSFLTKVQITSYRRDDQGGYFKRSLPPVTFEYSAAEIDETIHQVDAESLQNLPGGLDGSDYQWIDLDGEALPGVLTQQGGALFYKRNLSPINATVTANENNEARVEARFSSIESVTRQPVLINGDTKRYQLLDLSGDGQLDLVDFDDVVPGFYERTENQGWKTLTSFDSLPVVDWNNPNLKFIDLTGDGHADILISELDVFTWYPSLGEEGFSEAEHVPRFFDEQKGPAVIFADGTESIFLADFSGDGLSDIVRVRNGQVCYWPNLGYGRFGAQVLMDNSPWFDRPDQFDGRRLRLADVDGSGLTDIVYLASDGVQLYFNQSGNGWSAGRRLNEFPRIDDVSWIAALDLLGIGTACLAWSSPLPGADRREIRYIDLMSGQKPHLLTKVKNNLGVETTIQYAPSTKFYLLDKLQGKPWITRLPFPVHCVERVAVYDKWRNATFTTSYSYHHGYFDGVEREFRGFGRVDQIDAEDYGRFSAGNTSSPYITDDQTLYQPPVKTSTWFHTGAFIDERQILSHYAEEYFPNSLVASRPELAPTLRSFKENELPEPDFADTDLSVDEWREALRACKGTPLRQEIYELDVDSLKQGIEKPVRLFSTTYHNCHIDRLQQQGINQHAVFLVTESEAISYHYELDLRTAGVKPDPRVTHTLNLNIDEFGQVLQSVSVAYPRLNNGPDTTLPAEVRQLAADVQAELHLAYTENIFTRELLEDDHIDANRLPLLCESILYDLTGIGPADADDQTTADDRDNIYFSLDELRAYRLSERYQTAGKSVSFLDYHKLPDGTAQKRLVERVRTLYFDDASNSAPPTRKLDFGQHGPRGFKYENYKLALTGDLLDSVFKRQSENGTEDLLAAEIETGVSARSKLDERVQAGSEYFKSGYIPGTAIDPSFAAQYWMRSGTSAFAANAHEHFFLPTDYIDPFGKSTSVRYDKYDLFIETFTDPLSNTIKVKEFDYRVLSPKVLEDQNGNQSAVVFDTLGMPVASALMGKGGIESGDDLNALELDIAIDEIERFLTTSYSDGKPHQWLANSTLRFIYDFGVHVENDGSVTYEVRPAAACGIARETHKLAATNIQVTIQYSDGTGSVLVAKTQAEPDPEDTSTDRPLRWIANGKTIFNNKGKPVKQYEPFFSDTEHRFVATEAQREVGVTPVMYYDAVGRQIRSESPDGSYSRVEFTPWHVASFDANDTVGEPNNGWFDKHTEVNASSEDKRAASLALVHHNTPALTVLDSLGRDVIAVAHNRIEDQNGSYTVAGRTYRDEFYLTFTKLDAEGKPLWIRDPNGNLVMQYIISTNSVPGYDIAGNLLFQHSMDAGDRWTLMDAAGKPLLGWDFNNRQDTDDGFIDERRVFFFEYDELHRPVSSWLRINNDARQLIERFEYRDARDNDAAALLNNLQGQLVRHFDPSGLMEVVKRDFKGNTLQINRTLNNQPQQSLIDWQGDPQARLEAETFTKISEYDALNRITKYYNWHLGDGKRVAIYEPSYNERGLLKSQKLTVRATKSETGADIDEAIEKDAIREIRYNEKGQKIYLRLGNDTLTQYEYAPETFRLIQIFTTRPGSERLFVNRHSNLADASVVQELNYTYDPVGNITEISDEAYEPVFFNNAIVEPKNLYEYDALYRLINATGRESSQLNGAPTHLEGNPAEVSFPVVDPNALRKYTQTYAYDPAGNIKQVSHQAPTTGSWTRDYAYAFEDPTQQASNRLWQTWTGGTNGRAIAVTYLHDLHGNMLNLERSDPRFNMRWDYRDMIATIDLGGGGIAYYQYDSSRQRTRKRIEKQNGSTGFWERIYLGGFELYRRYTGDGSVLVEEIETHHLSEGEQRVLLVDDVITASDAASARPDGLTVNAQTLFRYQYSNHLGSACLELDQDRNIISYEEFHPHGTSAYRASGSNVKAPPKRFRFTGMERDEESGLNYHRARFLAAWLGVWLSPDPSFVNNDLNTFRYVRNNSVNLIDRTGEAGVQANKGVGDARRTDLATALDKSKPPGQIVLQEQTLKDPATGKTANNVGPEGPNVENPQRGQALRTRRQHDVALLDKPSKTAVSLESATTEEALLHPKKYLQAAKDSAAVRQGFGYVHEGEFYQYLGGTTTTGDVPQGKWEPIPLGVSPTEVERTVIYPQPEQLEFDFQAREPAPSVAPTSSPVQTAPAQEPAVNSTPVEAPVSIGSKTSGMAMLGEVATHPATGFIVGSVLKHFTQPISMKIVNEVGTYETNRMLADFGGPPMTADESSKLAPQHQAFVESTFAAMPPVIDIGAAAVSSVYSAVVTDLIARPWITEFYKQYPTTIDAMRIWGQ